jgi:stage II sporulation protein D
MGFPSTRGNAQTLCGAIVTRAQLARAPRHFMLSLRDSATFMPKGSLRSSMRRLTLPVALLVALACVASATASPAFVLRGHGWGHGVGMSQWGAYGLARGYAVDHHYTWQEIVAHYFQNTTTGRQSKNVSVLLVDSSGSVNVGTAFRVESGARSVKHAGTSAVSKTSTGRIKVSGIKGTFASPARISPTSGHLALGARRYRGAFIVSVLGGGVRVVNALGVDAYVRGVVTNESPAGWGDVGAQAALEAQAVAARSYALWTVAHGGGKCGGHLCPDTRDQVYGGFSSETQNGSEAVKTTAGKVVLFGGSVAETFFSSSSGGRTAASVDTWGGNVSYLQSVDDPADLNPDNPNRSWNVRLTPRALANKLGSPRAPTDAIVTQRASGRVAAVRLSQPGWSKTFSGGPEHFRSVLGLRSSLFALGVLDIVPATAQTVCEGRLSLDVLARNVPNVTLQSRRTSGGTWVNRTAITTDRATVVDRPCRGTTYRLHSPSGTGGNVAVQVAARIAFRSTQPAGGVALRGFVKPVRLAGETVYVSRRRADLTWHRVATATVKDDGSWRAEFNAIEGTYRARLRPPTSSGLVQGISAPFDFTLH